MGVQFSSVLFSRSIVSDSLRPHEPQHARTPGLPVHHQLPESTQTHVHCVSDAIQPSHPLSSPSLSALNLSQQQGLFKWVSSSHQVAKGFEFQLQHQSFNEHPGLISFRMDWLDLLAVQGTLKCLPQHHSSKASILWCSAFFTGQLSHPYMTTGKTIYIGYVTLILKCYLECGVLSAAYFNLEFNYNFWSTQKYTQQLVKLWFSKFP